MNAPAINARTMTPAIREVVPERKQALEPFRLPCVDRSRASGQRKDSRNPANSTHKIVTAVASHQDDNHIDPWTLDKTGSGIVMR
ncbi:hypothetical protein GCM10025778_09320 [Paeniglutamicibacter antarcticus]|uniref:Uncharacterized protein n=1 Tax=Paeniglutamicibacter antarcticus TaxID=494023 RepID=A0ABP9TII6_9MICC